MCIHVFIMFVFFAVMQTKTAFTLS